MSTEQSAGITQQQIDQLTQAIKNAGLEGMGPKDEFCQNWNNIKTGLQALQTILGIVPGVSALAVPAVAIVLAAGNAASSAICSK
jgi:hypothetical protein